ncbi:DUF917 family protein [Planktothrix sp. FACHB-1355]|uniref:DUF917 family protein n=1 Tax=Aerosakkonema funiforme FACHB-1375 TaxID=2949571 RepID=A0A926VGC1_9CYAN|nr:MULTISPECIES: DUF917 domain-containing protein [Oscillatoriales]MBD2183400.1 DUF917 family protein [Aerosakkonema funiforme FACHB-1375]MBD3557494.1 DUF917 family protein [Planktothrix sp. FACHB-1355]
MTEINDQDLKDIINGAALLGSGGGGSLELGYYLATFINCPVQLKEVEELGVDDWGAVILGISAADASLPDNTRSSNASPKVLLNKKMFRSLKGVEQYPIEIQILIATFEYLQTALKMDKDFSYSLAGEIGTANLLAAMLTANAHHIPVVDADGAGRSLPELSLCTYYWSDIPIYPSTLANIKPEQDKQVKAVIDAKTSSIMARFAEKIVGTEEFGFQGVMATYAMNGQTIRDRKPVIKGTITKALQIGAILREAKQKQLNPITVLIDFLNNGCSADNKNAFLLFQGKITEVKQEEDPRFQSGTLTLRNQNKEVRVDYLNENLIAWQGGRPIAMGPDLICYLTPEGIPLTNADNLKDKKGSELALIGLKAPEQLRQDSIIKAFMDLIAGLGYKGNYVPIEKLQKEQASTTCS